jgi:hypothetical protein
VFLRTASLYLLVSGTQNGGQRNSTFTAHCICGCSAYCLFCHHDYSTILSSNIFQRFVSSYLLDLRHDPRICVTFNLVGVFCSGQTVGVGLSQIVFLDLRVVYLIKLRVCRLTGHLLIFGLRAGRGQVPAMAMACWASLAFRAHRGTESIYLL